MTDIPTRSTISASGAPPAAPEPPVRFVTVLTTSDEESATVLGVYRSASSSQHAPEALAAAKVLRDARLDVHIETLQFGRPTETAITYAGLAAFRNGQ